MVGLLEVMTEENRDCFVHEVENGIFFHGGVCDRVGGGLFDG